MRSTVLRAACCVLRAACPCGLHSAFPRESTASLAVRKRVWPRPRERNFTWGSVWPRLGSNRRGSETQAARARLAAPRAPGTGLEAGRRGMPPAGRAAAGLCWRGAAPIAARAAIRRQPRTARGVYKALRAGAFMSGSLQRGPLALAGAAEDGPNPTHRPEPILPRRAPAAVRGIYRPATHAPLIGPRLVVRHMHL